MGAVDQLLDGNFTQSFVTLTADRMGEWWPALPYVAVLISIRIMTKSDGATAFSSIFGLLVMAAADYRLPIIIHPAVYGIAVLSTAMLLFKAYYSR